MAYDKKLHVGAGLLIAIAGGCLFTPDAGLVLAAFAGLLKEVRDDDVYGDFDPLDLAATLVGGLAGYGIVRWML